MTQSQEVLLQTNGQLLNHFRSKTVGKIELLSDEAIDQIAAGEVIENPASVVKELVENAVDAGARKIVIAILGGGLQSIQVSDDGCGMSEEDAVRCFLRFATSKIRKVDDLLSLSTMGFRGEALAAIAAISKVVLRTAARDGEGCTVEVEGGKVGHVGKCAHTRGTTFEVRSLFYNVPARKKFQKSPSVCAAEITRIVSLLALAHPDVAFELFQQERSALTAPQAPDLFNRVQDVLGEGFLRESLPLNIVEKDFKLTGVIGSASESRINRSGQYLFINKRPVHCLPISYAVKDGYGTRIEELRHPLFVLHLNIESNALDVNVHPQKKEVRIRDEKSVREKVKQAIFETLEGSKKQASLTPFFFSDLPPVKERDLFFKFAEKTLEKELEMQAAPSPPLRALGVVGQFLLVDALSLPEGREEGVVFVDLEAARTRVLYHFLQTPQGQESQGLIFPVTVTLSAHEGERLEAHMEEIAKVGIVLRSIGKGSFLIDALPPFLPAERACELLSLIVEEFSIKEILDEERARSLARLAARALHRDKKGLSQDEALALFEELLQTPSCQTSPDGKPTFILVTHHEIAKFLSFKKSG